MNNKKLRTYLAANMLKYWQLARIMGISEMTLTRKLRDELPEPEQDRICKLIDEYVKNGGQEHE